MKIFPALFRQMVGWGGLSALLFVPLLHGQVLTTGVDVGSGSVAGTNSYNSGTYTLTSSGADIWGTSDAFHYVYSSLPGDGELVARVVSVSGSNPYAKAALMVRQSTVVGSSNATMVLTYSQGTSFQWRSTLNGSSTQVAGTTTLRAPYWLKVIKDGTLVSAYESADGITYYYVGCTRLTSTNPVDIGLAVTAHTTGVVCTAMFDNVTLLSQTTYAPSAPWSDQDIGTSPQGQTHLENGIWSQFGGGLGVSGTADGLHLDTQAITTGNCAVVAEVTGLSANAAASGVFIRQDLTSNGVEAAVLLKATGGITMASRATAGGTATNAAGAAVSDPFWVKLIRTGNNFYGYSSPDGSTWTLVSSPTIPMTGTVYAGIGTSSGSTSALALAQLSNVQVTLPPAVTSSATATSTSEGPFSYTITGSNNPYLFGASGLPAGLSVNPATGVISGSTSGALGTYPVTLSVTNAYGTATQTLTLTVTPASLTWTGSTNTTWDATTLNWTNGSTPVTYVEGDAVTLSDTGSGGTLTLGTSFHPLSVTASNSSKSYTLTGSGGLAGTMTLTKTGTGTLTLSESNTFTGLTTVNGGTLQFRGSSAWPSGSAFSLGSATVAINHDGSGSNGTIALGNNITLDASATATISVANNGSSNTGNKVTFGALNNGTAAQAFNSTFNFVGANGYSQSFTSLGLTGSNGYATTLNPTSSPITIAGNVINQQTSYSGHYDTLDLSGTVAGNSITGAIADSSGYTSVGNGDTRLTANGTGTWTLSGASTYHGPTAISGGTLNLTGSWANTQSVTTSGTGVLTESSAGAIKGTATFTQGSSGTTTLAGANTYTGATAVNAGVLLVSGSLTSSVSVASGAALGGAGSITGNVTVASGGKLLYSLASGSITGPVIHGNLTLNGTINVTPPATGSLNPGTYTLASYTGAFSGTPTFVWTPPAGNTDTATFSTSTPGVIQVVVSSSSAPISSGLALWLKSDKGIALDANGKVSTWSDQSPNGFQAAQANAAARPSVTSGSLNGIAGVTFDGASSYLRLPDNVGLDPQSGITLYVVCKPKGTGTYRSIISRPYRSDGSWNAPYVSYGAWIAPSNVPYLAVATAGVETDSFAGAGIDQVSSYIVTSVFDGQHQTTSLGVNAGTSVAVSGSIDYNGATAADLAIGASEPTAPIGYYSGDICEIVLYNRVLTSSEQQQVTVYLANRYGLYNPNATWPLSYTAAVQTEITRNQWNKSQADAYVAFLATNPPVPPTGLALWLKADTGVTIDGSGNVSNWSDQSINHNDAFQSTVAIRPASTSNVINGKPVVRFNGTSTYLRVTDQASLRISGCTILTVLRPNPTAAYQCIISKPYFNTGWSNPYASYILGITPSNTPYLSAAYNSSSFGSVGSINTLVSQGPLLITCNYGGGMMQYFENGALLSSTSVSNVSLDYSGAVSADLALGINTPYAPASYYNGDIAEVLIYDHPLSSADQQIAEIYLASKYGLSYPAPPTITPAAGAYTVTQNIGISSILTGGIIYYTLDGTTPTTSSPIYSTPISLSSSALVQAFAAKGTTITPISQAQFYVNDPGQTGLAPPPTSLVATASVSGGEVDLSWLLPTPVTYSAVYVYRSLDGGAYQLVNVLDAGQTNYADTNVLVGHAYTYQVGTVNAIGSSNTSSSSSIHPITLASPTIVVTTPSNAVAVP